MEKVLTFVLHCGIMYSVGGWGEITLTTRRKEHTMTIEISRETAKEMLLNDTYLELLIDDYQMGMALDEEQNSFFGLSDEEQAQRISSFLSQIVKEQLFEKVFKYIKNNR